jgi:hypothetical protein
VPRLSRVAAGLVVAAVGLGCVPAAKPSQSAADGPEVAELRGRSMRADDVDWLAAATGPHPWLRPGATRSEVVWRKDRLLADGDPTGAAEAAGVLAAEAQVRAARVLQRWGGRVDPGTGLLPKGLVMADRVWDYANAGADLYPHLVIAAALLRPGAYPSLLEVLPSERALARPDGLPADVGLISGRAQEDEDLNDRMYGAVEYAKDALLPMTERLGPGPWLDRMQELARTANGVAPIKTRFGPIPSDTSEVNGQMLQVLSRLYWATGDEAYFSAAERIARAYLELALPDSGWVPMRSWDFRRERSNTRRAELRDHGNEIVAGLVEFHMVETARGAPGTAEHRVRLRMMLDRLLDVGRTPDGLWKSEIDLETGQSHGYALSDNWGYLYAAYLTQAMVEETWPGGDAPTARRYRAAAGKGLEAAAALDLYPWQGVEQDGYADTIESALYLLNRTDSTAAASWVERQAGTLFGAQDDDGRVEDRYLDGNFVRTALLYAAWQTQGVRLDPWEVGAMLGAVPHEKCLTVALAVGRDWSGRVIFDTPRHRLHLGLPLNYPRLNEWPEWFAAEAGWQYAVDDSGGEVSGLRDGAALSDGLDVRLGAGTERRLEVCPAAR